MFLQIDCRKFGIGAILASLAWCAVSATAGACDTPVYRYAMYRWFPAPYEVYHFYRDKLDSSAEAVKAAIDEVGDQPDVRANIVFLPVDLNKDKDLTSVPPDVKEAWTKLENPEVPSYLISSPLGMHLYRGKLTEKDLPSLIDSPLRQQACKQLAEGKAGVFLLLTGKDSKATERAEKLLQGVTGDVASGKIELYMAPPIYPVEGEEAKPPQLQVGYLKVPRDDPQEKWLVKSLLALEPDLPETDSPIIFMLYGRGRALFSCLDKGIERDNLIMDVEFITGACSCTVKDQNPGVDLLMRFNWDAAAEHLARGFAGEEGSEYAAGPDSMFPELVIPGGEAPAGEQEAPSDNAATQVASSEGVEPAADKGSDSPAEPAADDTAKGSDEPAEATDAASKEPAETRVANNQPPTPAPVAPAAANEEPSTLRGVLLVGAGLAAALVVLFAATFMVLRPK